MVQPMFNALARSRILRDYEEAFRAATGMALTLVPAEVPEKRIAFGRNENPFCALIAGNHGGCAACMKIQADVLRKMGAKIAPHEARCFAGLSDVAMPVVVGGKHIATLFGGQVFREKPERRQFRRLTKLLVEWGFNTNLRRVEEAYFHTKVIPQKQFDAMVRLLGIFAQHLSESANRLLIANHAADPAPVALAKSFVQARAGDSVSMREAAHHVHLSAFYFCKMFRKATGMTFTEYVARVRVEKAETLLANPRMRVSEAAYAAGFQSIPNFNRVFKKFAGVSPSQFRQRAENSKP